MKAQHKRRVRTKANKYAIQWKNAYIICCIANIVAKGTRQETRRRPFLFFEASIANLAFSFVYRAVAMPKMILFIFKPAFTYRSVISKTCRRRAIRAEAVVNRFLKIFVASKEIIAILLVDGVCGERAYLLPCVFRIFFLLFFTNDQGEVGYYLL